MKKFLNKYFYAGVLLLIGFVIWTILICSVDKGAIGPEGSVVGFSALNGFFNKLTGVNMMFYTVTDWAGLVPVGVGFGFAIFGLCQWIKRRSIKKVDLSLIILGVFYIVVMIFYLGFEELALNYRPVLINGVLEASYPSSTTLLVLCVMGTAIIEFNFRIKNIKFRRFVCLLIAVFSLFMVVGRVLSGVHWITDIIGSVLLSSGLVSMYYAFCKNSLG